MIQNGEYGSPFFRGAVLAPWPNRLEDGYYEFGGQAYSVPINEPGRFVALHGLALDREWVVISRGPDRVRLRLERGSDAGYPFDLSLEMTYSLTAYGMKASLTATNNGESPAPYGCSFHPYFLPGEGLIDDVELRLEAHSWIECRRIDCCPVGPETDIPADYDLRAFPRIGSRHLDATYGAVERDSKGIARVQFGRLDVWWDKTLPWVQVYTTPERDAVAIEPEHMSGQCLSNRHRPRRGRAKKRVAHLDVGLSRTLVTGLDGPLDRAEIESLAVGASGGRGDRDGVAVFEERPGRSVVELDRLLTVPGKFDERSALIR